MGTPLDATYGSLKAVRAHRERVRALRPGRFHIIAVPPGSWAYHQGVRFALVPDDERAEYEAAGAQFVEIDPEGVS